MKERTGFVSNSSSSSFIVAFPFIPHSQEEISNLLFTNGTPGGYPVEKVSQVVFNDILGSFPLSEEEMVKELSPAYSYMRDWEAQNPAPDWPKADASVKERKDFNKKHDAFYKKQNKERERRAKIRATEFIKENKEAVFLKFSYSDEDGSFYSSMEHDGTFDQLPHITISHH